jgi:hypothetical protein
MLTGWFALLLLVLDLLLLALLLLAAFQVTLGAADGRGVHKFTYMGQIFGCRLGITYQAYVGGEYSDVLPGQPLHSFGRRTLRYSHKIVE